jgi:thiol-disulfide isomerase/thioredoxin
LKLDFTLLIVGLLALAGCAQDPKPESKTPRSVTYIDLQKEDEKDYTFTRNTNHEWTFELAKRPVLARLEGQVYHSGFNAPLRVEINGKKIGILRVDLPNLRDGAYQFFKVPRPEVGAEGFSFVADAVSWQPAWIFLERPFLLEGTNHIRLISSLDMMRIRNLRLEVLQELPQEGAMNLLPNPSPPLFDKTPFSLPPLVSLQQGEWKPFTAHPSPRYTALYFSAHWCGPCRAFTPRLVEWYQRIRPKYPDFELIFVSRDRSEADMLNYALDTQMPWPAVPFDQIDSSGVHRWSASGIPYLIFIGPDGLPVSAKDRTWRPPDTVLQEIEKVLTNSGSPNP